MTTIHVQNEYADAAFLAVDKSAGLLAVPGRGMDKQDCLLARVLARHPEARVVHRLDRDTSGILLFALSHEAQRNLGAQFENRAVEKTYIAMVKGRLGPDAGVVDYPLRKDMDQRLPPRHLIDCVRGKRAITEWRVLERHSNATRIELRPITGRSHQLRVHMQGIGHPIVGDPIYGTPAQRLMLHHARIVFAHPSSGGAIALECAVPF